MKWTKQEVKERIREAIKDAIHARDNGYGSHDTVQHLRNLIGKVSKMSAGEIEAFTESHAGFEE